MKRIPLVVLALVALLALAAAPALAQGDKSDTLNIALQQELDTLNPIYTQMWYGTTVHDLFLAPAWWIDDEGQAIPAIASEIPSVENGGVSADGTIITIKIRDNAVWSDGEPITADDFIFTYNMILDESNTVGTRYPYDQKIKSVEAPDEHTVVVTYNEPFAAWVTTLFSGVTPPLPEHVLQPAFDSEGSLDAVDWNRAPVVSSGPYKFVEWEAGSHMSFTANENYFLDKAQIPNIFISFVPDDATVVSSLVSGDSDVGTFIAAGDTPALKEAGVNIALVASGYNEGLFFNVSPELGNPALQDINVRKALVMLINRDKINTDLNLGLVQTGSSFWENTPYKNPDTQPIAYDPEGAKKLLDDAGWVDSNGDGTRDKDGVELVLRYVTNQRQIRKDIQAIVQQEYQDAGIGVDIQNFDSDIFFASYSQGGPMGTGQYDIGEYSSSPSFPDPDTSRFTCAEVPSEDKPDGINENFYCDPELDTLFQEQARTVDPEKRIEIFHQIDQKLSDAVVWTSMWYDPDLWAINGRIENTRVSGADPLWNAANWTIAS